MTAQLEANQPVVDLKGNMTQRFRTFLNEVFINQPILGDGSPEGVVTAPLYSKYIDRTGVSGSIEYIKMTAEIGGDRTKGWVLV